MKNKSIISAFKKNILKIFIIGTSLMVMSFINPKPVANSYQIVSSKVYIAGGGKTNNWKLAVDNSKFDGNFITDGGEQLEDIRGFSFSFPIQNLNTANQLGAEILKNSFQDKNCGEITFSQKNIMILPIMKSIHLVGEITIGNKTNAVPMHMQYLLNKDGSITVYGKQFVKLTEFGINLTNAKPADMAGEVTINIVLELVKEQIIVAKIRTK